VHALCGNVDSEQNTRKYCRSYQHSSRLANLRTTGGRLPPCSDLFQEETCVCKL